MPNIVRYIRKYTKGQYLLGSSTWITVNSTNEFIESVDMILMHGNKHNSSDINNTMNNIRNMNGYKKNPKPIVFNEDDNYGFDQSINNFETAINAHASWGVFVDCNRTTAGDYIYGYQCVPPAWNINTPLKQSFFDAVKNYSSV